MQAEQVILGLTGLGRQGEGGGSSDADMEPFATRSSHQALGHHQVHSGGRDMRKISAEIYQIIGFAVIFPVCSYFGAQGMLELEIISV